MRAPWVSGKSVDLEAGYFAVQAVYRIEVFDGVQFIATHLLRRVG